MKTNSKTKTGYYQNITIQDESGMDTIRVRKQTFLAKLGARLREIAAERILIKSHN